MITNISWALSLVSSLYPNKLFNFTKKIQLLIISINLFKLVINMAQMQIVETSRREKCGP